MLQIILAILAFGILVIVHEFGHFITAKRGGVQVNEFWIGMGPTLLKKQHNGTLYCLKLLPFGGACVMEGEDGESENERAFGKASLPRRMLIVAAGALMNFLIGFLIVLAVIRPNGPEGGYVVSTLDSVDPASTAAAEGGLQAVSMNLWGFTPSFLPALDQGLRRFFAEKLPLNPMKGEYYLPFAVDELIEAGRASAKVLTTDARWFGVTYREDKPVVSAAIADMTRRGEYPPDL